MKPSQAPLVSAVQFCSALSSPPCPACTTCQQAYLASDTEGESEEEGGPAGEEDEQAIRERYRRLLLGGGEAEERHGKKDWGAGGSDEEEGGSEDGSEDGEEQPGDKKAGSKGATKVADDKGEGPSPACFLLGWWCNASKHARLQIGDVCSGLNPAWHQ